MTLEQRINRIVMDELGADEEAVTPLAMIQDDLGADSLDVTEIVMKIEDEFGIVLEEAESDGVATMQDLYDMVEKRVSKKR